MSLKTLHIVFVIASTLMVLGIGGWLIDRYMDSGRALHLALSVVCFLCAAGFVYYGKVILKKLKDIPYL